MQNYINKSVNKDDFDFHIFSCLTKEKYFQTSSIPFIIYLNRQSFLSQILSSSVELPFALIQKISPIYAALKGKIGRTLGYWGRQ